MHARGLLHIALGISLLGFGCGGRSRVEGEVPDSSGGTSAVGGGAGSDVGRAGFDSAAGATSIDTKCPPARPTPGQRCSFGESCNYSMDRCSNDLFVCLDGVWVPSNPVSGEALSCRNFHELGPLQEGDDCSCRGLLDCSFDECSTRGKVHASCDNSTWHVTSEPCTGQVCGSAGLMCKFGEVCVTSDTPTPACALDPCAEQSETLSCDCPGVEALCGKQSCTAKGNTLYCL